MEPDNQIWKMEWNAGMSVGIPEIDHDHKRFIFLVNDLNRSIVARWSLSGIKQRLQFIIEDAEQHFSHEEMLLLEWKYPDLESHAMRHEQIMQELHSVRENSISYGLELEWIEVGLKIKGILIDHIVIDDMKYAEFYRSNILRIDS